MTVLKEFSFYQCSGDYLLWAVLNRVDNNKNYGILQKNSGSVSPRNFILWKWVHLTNISSLHMMKFRQSKWNTSGRNTSPHFSSSLHFFLWKRISRMRPEKIRVSSLKRKWSQDVKNDIGEIRNQPVAAEDRLSRKHGS